MTIRKRSLLASKSNRSEYTNANSSVMVKLRKLVLALSVIFISGCMFLDPPKENFYTDELEESDVIRLPIIKPYDLLTIDSRSNWTPGRALAKDYGLSGTIDSMNVQSAYITFYGFSGDGKWTVLNIDSITKIDFLNYSDFCQKVFDSGLSSQLYSSKEVYAFWRDTKQLPWANAIFDRQK